MIFALCFYFGAKMQIFEVRIDIPNQKKTRKHRDFSMRF